MTPEQTHPEAERAAHYHNKCRDSAVDSAVYAYLAGISLIALKAALPHGQFMAACKKVGILQNTATNYRKVAEKLDAEGKLPTIGNLKLLADGAVGGEDKAKIAKAFHDAVDGATLTELYRAVGTVRPPKRHEYHGPNPDAKKLGDPQYRANELCRILADDLARARDLIHLVDDATRRLVLDGCVMLSHSIRDAKKEKK